MRPEQAVFAYVGAFVDELVRAGVRHVCISPGSRSAPLALTIAKNPALRTWMHIDERSGAFFALGLASALDEPVALLCTSGTAGANFLPAVVEAQSAAIPLLVFTADRPPELREIGAAQTVDQNSLFGAHAKWFVEVALPEATPELLRYARTLAARTVAKAMESPAGPVHLNFPFREPLVPAPVEPPGDLSHDATLAWKGRPNGAPWVRVTDGKRRVDDQSAARLAMRLRSAKRPLIVCGPQRDRAVGAPVTELARRAGAPLLADPLSRVRWGCHDRTTVIDRYDAILRHDHAMTSLTPDFMVRIGGVPTSKSLVQYMQRYASVPLVVVDPARWPDPTLLAEEMVHADPVELCEQLLRTFGGEDGSAGAREWLTRWRRMNAAAGAALERYTDKLDDLFEGRSLADVVAALPERGTLFVSNSMPVRDLDSFGGGDERDIRVLANRGANGIDGIVSSALGAAAAAKITNSGPVALVIGDLALYHDMNGLLAARLHQLDLTVVVINNDGGGIFSFLPQAGQAKHFEELFGTPHGLDFRPVADLYGAEYHRVSDSGSLRRCVALGVASRGLHLIEVPTDRARNVELHRDAWAAVATALDNM
ncbi:MAG TPA: 2-succinyl-5-enolpyruvyl-6-hydroxy-3-cyclohexene-1-carboxylic-acid synthase [Gemmatimonadaceae bacterium]|nr:2-succinyl-5-enolpyruvyl-6-hydroxy-3-cyclohexene-1-carboxylic-acid synthase [Gemmatimonadaceae bacterium]